MKLYDVCGDFSLDPSTDSMPLRGYRWAKAQMVSRSGTFVLIEVGIEIKNNEIHYVRTESDIDLTGLYL